MLNNLDFLNKFKNNNNKYKVLYFFKSDFESNTWTFKFNKEKIIDFNIKLQDNSKLTDSKNKKTLYTVKTLILEFLLHNEMYRNSEGTIIHGINGIMKFIGLINTFDKDNLFSKYGFKALDKDFFINIINKRLKSNNLFYVYEGEKSLDLFLTKYNLKKEKYTINDIKNIENIIKDKNIDLQKQLFPYKFGQISFSLNKILTNKNKSVKYKREYESYFRYDIEENNASVKSSIKPFINSLFILNLMHKLEDNELSLPFKEDIEYVLNYNFESKELKHFETYPFQTILDVFKLSLDFHFEYGKDIIDSFINFLDNLENDNKINSKSKIISKTKNEKLENIINKSLVGKLKNSNIKYFKTNKEEDYFKNIREHNSLYELLTIYYGCVQFVVGALMARRQSEINSLEIDCFDDINLQLNFRKSKSYQHSFGIKDYISLPCPEIVIEMLENINKIAKKMKNNNDDTKKIFFIPKIENPYFQSKCKKTMYKNLDHMFDYFEVDLIEGKRPYIRQHQLRRFFAMSFFWSNGFKSIDTLRWFLGHTNAEHVYHYIKENTTGEVLNNVKAQYISENIKEYESLKDIFENKYHISNYNLIEKEDLADYINTMLEDGLITVEPEFIEDDNGKQFEIIIKVKNHD